MPGRLRQKRIKGQEPQHPARHNDQLLRQLQLRFKRRYQYLIQFVAHLPVYLAERLPVSAAKLKTLDCRTPCAYLLHQRIRGIQRNDFQLILGNHKSTAQAAAGKVLHQRLPWLQQILLYLCQRSHLQVVLALVIIRVVLFQAIDPGGVSLPVPE